MSRGRFAIRAVMLTALFGLCAPTQAAERTFALSGQNVLLEDVSAQAPVYFRSMRFNRALNVWNVEVSVTNNGPTTLNGPVVLSIESFANTSGLMGPDGSAEGKPFLDLSTLLVDGALLQGEGSVARTLTLARTGTVAPSVVTKVFARPAPPGRALAVTRTLDGAGQPLPGVSVLENGPAGSGALSTDARFGLVTLGQGVGVHSWQFSRTNHLPVWRRATLAANDVLRLPHPRLARRGTNTVTLTPASGTDLTDAAGSVVIHTPPGFVASSTTATLTPLDGQSLPGLLPAGWSPVQAFWFELSGGSFQSATARLRAWSAIGVNESATLARWDTNTLGWIAQQSVPGAGTNELSLQLPSAGAYALVVPDGGPSAPPPVTPGQALPGTSLLPAATDGLRASGLVEPPVNVASAVPELVTATATVTFSNVNGALPSGTVLNCEVREEYQLQDGTRRVTPRYDTFIAGYQRSGAGIGALTAQFPLRPLLLLGGEELLEARVTVEVLPSGAFAGSVMETNGGLVLSGGVQVLAGDGDFARREGALLRQLDPTNFFGVVVGPSNVIVNAFQLDVSEVSATHHLAVRFGPQTTNQQFVLARVLSEAGLYGIEPVERFASDASGQLQTVEPANGERLSGITGAGQYLLLRALQPYTLVTGVVRDFHGDAVSGAPVRLNPWLAFSGPAGAFRLLAPLGASSLSTTDPINGDTGQLGIVVPSGPNSISADLAIVPTGPRVLSVTPTNSAVSVSRVIPIVVNFSEPVNAATLLGGGFQLLGTNGVPVAAGLSLNLAGTSATLLPVDPLAGRTVFTIRLSTNVTDRTGNKLEGPNQFAFTTESDSLNRAGAQLIIYEPTNGLAPIFGTPGSADPESPVILVNETSGETATILSKPDGSFTNFIAADVDDSISAVLVNQNGTRTTLPASRQVFRDGSVGLFNGGGILEAESDGGPVQIIVEPGAIPEKTTFKLEPLPLAEILNLISNVQPQGGKVLGGFRYTETGDAMQESPHVSFAVQPDQLGLPPGTAPEDGNYALTVPSEYDGVVVYEIIDRMRYQDGKLVTSSPPFPGVNMRTLLANTQNTHRRNLLQERVVGPNARTVCPTTLPPGQTVVLKGKVVSRRVNAQGVETGASDKDVAGAVVAIEQENPLHPPEGRLAPGQFTAISGEDGEFALLVPSVTVGEAGFNVVATHPRFPSQAAFADAARAASAEIPNVMFRLRFAEYVLTDLSSPDILAPRITISHLPVDPAPSLNPNAGATVLVTALDDRGVSSLSLNVQGSVPIGTPTPAVNVSPPTELSSTQIGGTGKSKIFRVTSNRRSRVTLQAQATDDAGNLALANYDLVFAGDLPTPPTTGDTNGPRAIFVWPPAGTVGVKSQEPIIVRFSKSIDTNLISSSLNSWLQFSTGQKPVSVVPTGDAKQISIYYSGPAGSVVTFTLNSQLTDLGGHGFDQDPATAGNQSFTHTFNQAVQLSANLPGIDAGGGVVMKGAYAYLIDREGDHGRLEIINVSDPANPATVGSLVLPEYPRDLALIPNWTFKLRPTDPPRTADLVAVAGGVVGAPDGGGSIPNGQFLWIIDVSDPAQPRKLVSSTLTFGIATVPKLKWFAPHLAYLEFDADASSVGLINLQSYLIGFNATPAEAAVFPENGFDGVDANHDGDYCDPGDQLPLPARLTTSFFGKEFAFTPDTTQMITDFDVDPERPLLGVILKPQTGATTEPGKYVTLYSGTGFPDPGNATYEIQFRVPRRVAVFSGVQLQNIAAPTTTRDLAFVSIEGNPGELQVLDISDPTAPHPIVVIPMPTVLGSQSYNFGTVQSLQRRADGLLALAGANDVILLDPRRILLPPSPTGISAAIVGIIQGAGSGARSFVSDSTGLNLVNLGGKHSVIRTPPFLDLISFGSTAAFRAADVLAMSDDQKRERWRRQSSPATLLRTRLNFTGATLNTPPPPEAHYYLRMDAPGGAGPTLSVVMESLNISGGPLANSPTNGVPVRLATTNTLNAVGDTNSTVFPRVLSCFRLSNDPRSEFYNIYLSDPIVLNNQIFSPQQAGTLLAQGPTGRAIVKPDKYLWASLDPQMSANPVVGVFASTNANKRLIPGTAVRKEVEKPRLPLILVPGVAGSRLGTGGNADDDWLTLCRTVEAIDLNAGNSAVYATALLRAVTAAGIDIEQYYGPLVDNLVNNAGYVVYDDGKLESRRTVASADYSQQANGPNLFILPYDWRRDNKVSAGKLAQLVDVAFKFNPDAEAINILSHSMGGLVSRRFIIDQVTNRVSKFISVDTPYLGAPKLINVLQTGDFAPIPWQETRVMKRLVPFFPGPHQLAPSTFYFQAAGAAGVPMFEYGWDVDRNGNAYGGAVGYAQFKSTFDRTLFPHTTPVAVNEAFHTYSSASGNHQTVWTNDTTGVQNIHIFGMQHAIQTIGAVRHMDRTRSLQPCNNLTIDLADQYLNPAQSLAAHPTNDYSQPGSLRIVNHEVELSYTRGDHTVPEVSQTRKGNGLDFNDPKARTLTFYGTSPATDALTDHNGILLNLGALAAIRDYLDDIEPVTNAPPNLGPVTMFSVRISDLQPGTVISYDAAGAASAPPQPGNNCYATVANFKGGDLIPTGQGTFEFLTESIQAAKVTFKTRGVPFNVVLLRHVNGVIEDRFVFKGITAPTNSDFVIKLDPNGAHVIGLDTDGDVEPDVNLAPTVTLSGIAARDVTPPTVSQTLSGNGQDVLFTATDNGGGTPDVYLIHDSDGDGDLSDEVHERLANNQVAVSRITDNRFYLRAEDQALNLSTPQLIPLNTPPPPTCPNFVYDSLGAGLGTQTKLLEAIFKGQQPISSYGPLTNAGIPIFEGYELAVLNEFMALKSGLMLRIVDMTDSNQSDPAKKNPLYRKLRRQLTEVGQAVSRAGLALIIGTPLANNNLHQILFIDPGQFSSFASFEKYIAARAHTTSTIFTGGELTLLDKAAGAAGCESATLDSLLADDCTANTFLADSLKFIRHAQNILQTPYTTAMQILNDPLHPLFDPAQFAARTAALQKVYDGVQASQIDGLNILKQYVGLDLVVRVFNRGSNAVQNVKVQLVLNNQNQPAYQEVTIPELILDQVHYIQGDSHPTPNVPFSLLESISNAGAAPKTAYLLVDPAGQITESDKEDNWFGFRFYILDVNDPCPAALANLSAVPPPTTALLKQEPICE